MKPRHRTGQFSQPDTFDRAIDTNDRDWQAW